MLLARFRVVAYKLLDMSVVQLVNSELHASCLFREVT